MKRIISGIFALSLVFSISMSAFAQDLPPQGEIEFEKFMEIFELYEEMYLEEKTTEEMLLDTIENLIKSDPASFEQVLNALLTSDDPYGNYLDDAEVYDFMNPKQFGGIGVTVQTTETGTIITEVNTISPAATAGLMPDDVLVSIDGNAVASLALESISQMARGEVGTEVEYTVFRPSTSEMLSFTMVRETIYLETITYEIVEHESGDYAVCNIADFQGMTTYYEFVDFKNTLIAEEVKKIIFDVRGNPGGDADIVMELINWLIPEEGEVVATIASRYEEDSVTYYSTGRDLRFDEMVVLVDENSASAAELFAIALQDHELATIVGEQTFGKAIGQTYFQLSDGTMAALTTIQVLSPNGTAYNGVGVIPDIEVINTETPREMPEMEAFELADYESAKMGESNLVVKALEERLVLLGFMTKADELFEEDTAIAIKTYQMRAGLLQTGTLNFDTYESISETVELLSRITVETDDQFAKAVELITDDNQ